MSPPLSIANKTFVQEVKVVFLYYTRALHPTMLTALGSVAAHQEKPTEHTIQKVKQLLDYAATHLDGILTYHSNDLFLAGHRNTFYLSEKKTEADQGGIFSCQTTRRSLPTMEQC